MRKLLMGLGILLPVSAVVATTSCEFFSAPMQDLLEKDKKNNENGTNNDKKDNNPNNSQAPKTEPSTSNPINKSSEMPTEFKQPNFEKMGSFYPTWLYLVNVPKMVEKTFSDKEKEGVNYKSIYKQKVVETYKAIADTISGEKYKDFPYLWDWKTDLLNGKYKSLNNEKVNENDPKSQVKNKQIDKMEDGYKRNVQNRNVDDDFFNPEINKREINILTAFFYTNYLYYDTFASTQIYILYYYALYQADLYSINDENKSLKEQLKTNFDKSNSLSKLKKFIIEFLQPTNHLNWSDDMMWMKDQDDKTLFIEWMNLLTNELEMMEIYVNDKSDLDSDAYYNLKIKTLPKTWDKIYNDLNNGRFKESYSKKELENFVKQKLENKYSQIYHFEYKK
ncbi:hypothetical protein [Mesomycoplasma lagogenitalium]|uniref:Lipoprotein n=1 Tax=Mesomycoplasma lagogenitalium TaxID=171286 RepID=A0ABY8LSN2_9BACT|nr:hypothetical protein [Mesomycoplasma lagogenitalium]WGI36265.1 hypothetical protein QEG99_02180 [Mesomycoplasma lagogenitalium]